MAATFICGSTVMGSKLTTAKPFVAAPTQQIARLPVRPLVVAMAKRAKAADLRTEFASPEAIDAEVNQLKKDLFSMRIKFAKREEYNPAAMVAARRRVAVLLTIKREREIEQGINKRAARIAQREKLVEAGLGKFAR